MKCKRYYKRELFYLRLFVKNNYKDTFFTPTLKINTTISIKDELIFFFYNYKTNAPLTSMSLSIQLSKKDADIICKKMVYESC